MLLIVIVFVNLGQWQLRRLEERRALNRSIEAGLNMPMAPLIGKETDPETLDRRRVSVTGIFVNGESLVLRNQTYNGRPGADLVVPLQIAGSEEAVLINRGWIPLADSDPAARRIYDLEGEVTIEGIAHRTQTRPDGYFVPTDPMPKPGEDRLDAWFRVDIERIQSQVSEPLKSIFIEQSPGTETVETPPIPQTSINLSEGSHFGYALQWFSFAVVLIAIYTGFVWQEYKHEQ